MPLVLSLITYPYVDNYWERDEKLSAAFTVYNTLTKIWNDTLYLNFEQFGSAWV